MKKHLWTEFIPITKKVFIQYLNSLDKEGHTLWKHGKYHQVKRKYGDYLYAQDPEKFNVNFEEWATNLRQELNKLADKVL